MRDEWAEATAQQQAQARLAAAELANRGVEPEIEPEDEAEPVPVIEAQAEAASEAGTEQPEIGRQLEGQGGRCAASAGPYAGDRAGGRPSGPGAGGGRSRGVRGRSVAGRGGRHSPGRGNRRDRGLIRPNLIRICRQTKRPPPDNGRGLSYGPGYPASASGSAGAAAGISPATENGGFASPGWAAGQSHLRLGHPGVYGFGFFFGHVGYFLPRLVRAHLSAVQSFMTGPSRRSTPGSQRSCQTSAAASSGFLRT